MTSTAEPKQIGPYKIEQRLGAGGMGEVYRAFDERLRRRVALKHIRPDKSGDPKARVRFLREARIAAQMSHPTLVQVHDIIETGDELWIVMELVEGTPLDRMISEGRIPHEQGVYLALDIASGLAAIHGVGILHRDLKSQNVIVSSATDSAESGTGSVRRLRARILDFGLAQGDELEGSNLSANGEISGTLRSMSPEQAQGQALEASSDLFALGVLFYELFTGSSPFQGTQPLETLAKVCYAEHLAASSYNPQIPDQLSGLIDRLLAKDPRARPESAGEIVAFLQTLIQDPFENRDVGRSSDPIRSDRSQEESDNELFQLSGEKRRLTILVCELVGQDSSDQLTSNDLDPDRLFSSLSELRALVHRVVEKYGGYPRELQGHRAIVYFGYPQVHEDSARRAVLAALEIVGATRIPGMVLEDRSENLVLRAGAHTGPAVIRPFTGQSHRVALGRTLDVTQLIQKNAKSKRVEVSGDCRELIGEYFEDRALPPLHCPDSEPIPLFRISSARSIHDSLQASNRMPASIGQEQEAELLVDRFRLAAEGARQAVLISGEAGMGKTRLILQLRRRLSDRSFRWLSVSGSPYTRHLSLRPVAALLSQWLDSESAEPMSDSLREVLEQYDLEPQQTEPALRTLLNHASSTDRDLDTHARRSVLELVPELLTELAERPIGQDPPENTSPVMVLVFEDLQWMDSSTLEVISRLIDNVAAPILLMLTCRPGFLPPWGHRNDVTRLELQPLDDHHSELLVDRLTADHELSDEARRSILRLGSGRPLYLKALSHDACRRQLDGSTSERRLVPWALQDLLSARLERLGAAKYLAQTASMQSTEFSIEDLFKVWSLDRNALEQEVDQLVADSILEPAEAANRFRFCDPLFRAATRASLLESDQTELERLIGGAS